MVLMVEIVPLYRGEDVYPEQDTLTKIGFSFIGWNHEADGSGTAYVSGDSISQLVGEVTLYAQWVRNQYTINFDSAGGSSIQSINRTLLQRWRFLSFQSKKGIIS
ncbi:InlB B-repeat-containing protein [Vibrio metschnikovii]